jgi:predicted O-linked N-acetylglucosamine transferase (SPINDLY family)
VEGLVSGFVSLKNVLTRGKKKQALALLQSQRWPEAKTLFTQICESDKTDAEAWSNLMLIHLQMGELENARACGERVLQINPRALEVILNLGGLCAAEGKFEQAEQYCRQAIAIRPDFAGAHYNLGNALKAQAKYPEATEAYREAVRRQPQYPEALLNLGISLKEQGLYQEAIAAYNRVLQLNPQAVEALYNLGSAYTCTGQLDNALACLRRSIQVDPGFTRGHSNLLFTLNNSPSIRPDEIFAEHQRWGDILGAKYRPTSNHANDRDPGRRLRIGYVSPDFRGQHSITYYIESLLAHHHRDRVEIYGYAEVAFPDATTERLRALCDHWRITCNKSDEQVADMIRDDRIDILVDLAGHTASSRLPVFAFKPAPIQVSYLGYPNTTGLPVMDYRLTDELADPPGLTERYHMEQLVRLPHGFLCYTPPTDAPEPGDSPLEKNGYVTFGSFNSIAKVTPDVIRLWAAILNALPGSQLILKSHALSDAPVRERYWRLFSEQGIEQGRVQLLGQIRERAGHLALYQQVDIGLDPFPYNGTTTTCEALWMGVPVISLIGRAHAGRVGLSLLSHTGLVELTAKNEDEYLTLAVALARNPTRVKALRQSLRQRLRESPLCQGQSFAHDMEQAYRRMWRAWSDARK